MDQGHISIYERVLGWTLAAGALGFVAAQTWLQRELLAPSAGLLVCLGLGSAVVSWLATRPGEPSSPRLSMTFVLAALVLLPAPGALLVAAAGCAAGAGAGVAGIEPRGAGKLFAVLGAVGVARFLLSWAPLDNTADAQAFLTLMLLFAVVQGGASALGLVIGSLAGPGRQTRSPVSVGQLLFESVNVPLAWLLASLATGFGSLSAFALGGLTLFTAASLRRVANSRRELRRTHDALTARVTELATLHAIGREVLSSIDPARVFSIVDRECRKIFDLDELVIALVDRESRELRIVHRRRRRGRRAAAEETLDEGFATWVVREKRGLRINEAPETHGDGRDRDVLVDPETRSLLAVPLIVEDESIGLLCIQSHRPAAYDDHLLSVLTTIAQQAAVAIENARHYEMATVDSLTGLFLRPYFFRRLDEEHNRARRYGTSFGLLMMDLDGFKEINDRHGHLVGDRYLRAFGAAIRTQLRGADLACRYGGDEFCLLLPETDLEGAGAIAERIRQAVASLVVHVDALAVRTTTSIGVAVYPDHHAGDPKSLLRKADEALYRAKKLGRDRVVPFAA